MHWGAHALRLVRLAAGVAPGEREGTAQRGERRRDGDEPGEEAASATDQLSA
jgi:hypothetical protein